MELDQIGNPNDGRRSIEDTKKDKQDEKPKIIVILGATGSGKSRLAIDLASHFPIEIINADSMQVYDGLDILTNKVPLHEQKGVPHHLLGTINPDVEFTARHFRDYAIPLIDEILARNRLPVIVGGTNYYIQALVSPFLIDDSLEEADDIKDSPDDIVELGQDSCSYEVLKKLDPVAANRIHPNDQRKVSQYLNLYARSGVLPSQIFLGQCVENWGRVDNFRYNCCFIRVDASLPTLDQYVDHRVDCMVNAGLLGEVLEIYSKNADYTRGLHQAIGVREFEEFLKVYLLENETYEQKRDLGNISINKSKKELEAVLNFSDDDPKKKLEAVLNFSDDDPKKKLLKEAIDKVKANTQRLVRRQKRRLNRLQILFGWKIHFVDATEYFICNSLHSWESNVIDPAVAIIKCFLTENVKSGPDPECFTAGVNIIDRDLWTLHICEACGNKLLRGTYEWEQHKQGRRHRKRVSSLKKNSKLRNLEFPTMT